MLKLLHISDLHFGPPYMPEVGEALLKLAPDLGVEGIVVSGDLTQRAKAIQFQQARDFIDKLPDVPKVVIPGNHDVPLYRLKERLTDPLGLYRKHIATELDSKLEIEGVTLVGLDSTSPRRNISSGRLHLDQLQFARDAFAETPEENWRIVVAHHHFAPAHDRLKDRIMSKATRAIETFIELDIDMILGGHLHRAYIGNSLDFYTGDHRERGIIIVQCGTTTSRRGRGREREKNSFNLLEIDTDRVLITHYMYFSEDGKFAPVSVNLFPKPGKRLPS